MPTPFPLLRAPLTANPAPYLLVLTPQFVGGCDDTLAWLKSNYLAGSPAGRAPRVSHASDAFTPGDGAGYTYDLVVSGGGSGGLAASKEAAALGAKVAVRCVERRRALCLSCPSPLANPPRRCSTL